MCSYLYLFILLLCYKKTVPAIFRMTRLKKRKKKKTTTVEYKRKYTKNYPMLPRKIGDSIK